MNYAFLVPNLECVMHDQEFARSRSNRANRFTLRMTVRLRRLKRKLRGLRTKPAVKHVVCVCSIVR